MGACREGVDGFWETMKNTRRNAPGDKPLRDVLDSDDAPEDAPVHQPAFKLLLGRGPLGEGLVRGIPRIQERRRCTDRGSS